MVLYTPTRADATLPREKNLFIVDTKEYFGFYFCLINWSFIIANVGVKLIKSKEVI